jgi:hypothetical protein
MMHPGGVRSRRGLVGLASVALVAAACGSGGGAGGGDGPLPDAAMIDAPDVADAPIADAPVADAPIVDAPIADAPIADAPAIVDAAPVIDAFVADAAPPPDAFTGGVTLTVVNRSGGPYTGAVVLYSDNGGPWQAASGTGGIYHIPIVGPRYAIGRACSWGDPYHEDVWIAYRTLSDGPELRSEGCGNYTASVSGSVTWSGSNRIAKVSATGGSYDFIESPGSWSVQSVGGTVDVTAFLRVHDTTTPELMAIRRDVPAGTTNAHVNFATAGFVPVVSPLTVHDVPVAPGFVETAVMLDKPGSSLEIGRTWVASTLGTTSTTFPAPPLSELVPGETLTVWTQARGSSSSNRTAVAVNIEQPGPVELTLPPPYPGATVTVLQTNPDIRLGLHLPLVENGDRYRVMLDTYWYWEPCVEDSDLTFDSFWTLEFSASWAGGAPIDLEVPWMDMLGIGGWTGRIDGDIIDVFSSVASSALGSILPGAPEPFIVGDIRRYGYAAEEVSIFDCGWDD